MAGLPPKPREYDDYHRYPSDDRGRPAPMAPDRYAHPHPRDYYSSRSPHPPRSRASYAGDSYIATDSYVAAPAADTYIASGYDRRGDEERYRAEWDRYHAHERERRAYERDNARYDHERGYDRRHGDARDRDYPPYSERNRRWEGRSSPRRPTDHRESYRQQPTSSRRPPSPRHSRAHSRPRTRSPSPRQIRLGNHSISNSPHSPSKPNLTRDSRSVSPPSRRRTATPPRHRLPRRSPSPSLAKDKEDMIDVEREKIPNPMEPVAETDIKPKPSPTPPPSLPPPSTARVPVKSDAIPTGPRIRTTVRLETTQSSIPTGPAARYTEREKGKQKEQLPSVTCSDGDIKMRSRSPSPPREPRARPSVRGHSPPRGPRNAPRGPGWVKTTTTSTSPASFHLPTKSFYNSRNPSMVVASTPFLQPGQSPVAKPTGPDVVLPRIPAYKVEPSLTEDLDKEIARVQAHRAHLVSEYTAIGQRTRRALHELDMAAIDLRAAESRRKVAGSHMEKARTGVLGIDAVPIDSDTP